MSWVNRINQLFGNQENFDGLRGQVEVLRSTVVSLIQDVSVMKLLLREKGLWDENEYRRRRINQMLGDHKRYIINCLQDHSYFPYILEEDDFLRIQLKMTDDELRRYKGHARVLDSEG